MKQKVLRLVRHPLFSGSAVMIIGTNLNNVLSYLFHLFMGRMLGPAAYGEMAALFSLIILVSTVPSSLSLAVIKFVSSAKNPDSLSRFMSLILVWSGLVGGVITLLLLLFSRPLSSFLNLSSPVPVFIISWAFVFLLPSFALKSALQGLLQFNSYVVNILAESGSKLLFGILFVQIGWSVSGSISGILVSTLIGLFIGYLYVSKTVRFAFPKFFPLGSFLRYSVPVMIYSLAGTSLFTTDLILVKHFFSPFDAGTYAALSTMGKIIIFGAGPVSGVMFPLVSRRHASHDHYRKIFWYGFALTGAICLAVLAVYFAFPRFAVSLLYGHKYLQAAGLLFPFGIFITLYTLSSFLVGFFLSVSYTRVVWITVLAAVAQIIGIFLFHSTIFSVIFVSIIVSLLLFLGLLAALKIKTAKILA